MRLFTWFTIFAFLPLLFAQDALPTSNMTSLGSSLDERMERRQVVTLNVCANLYITFPGITVLGIRLLSITLLDPFVARSTRWLTIQNLPLSRQRCPYSPIPGEGRAQLDHKRDKE